MNTNTTIDFYPVEIAYRREQMLRDRAPMRRWLRGRATSASSAPKNRTAE
ncbi:MAG TPA: hypothetical protein VFE07_15180 [Marmoricola sp.]|jgi:hypothetical protein|nr:hypothetical protein [Marmoricola sp.]